MSSRPLRPIHRARRFASSIRPGRISESDREFVRDLLTDAEDRLFERMSSPDQRHAVAVAHAVEVGLADLVDVAISDPNAPVAGVRFSNRRDRDRTVLAAALLHDVGKNAAGLRTYGRVVATLSGRVAGDDVAEVWQSTSGFTRRVGLYLRYPALGADMLRISESHSWVIAWAEQHHEPPESWSIPLEIGELLSRCDDC